MFKSQHSRLRQDFVNSALVEVFFCVVIFACIGYFWHNAGCSAAGKNELKQVYNAIKLFADNNDGRLPANVVSLNAGFARSPEAGVTRHFVPCELKDTACLGDDGVLTQPSELGARREVC